MINVLGFKAHIFLKYEGNIQNLSEMLSEKFLIPNFRIETDQDPPHETFFLCEVLGSELWLNYSNKIRGLGFELMIESSLSFEEKLNNQVYDLSLWFARYVSDACKLTCYAVDANNEGLYFVAGKAIGNHDLF